MRRRILAVLALSAFTGWQACSAPAPGGSADSQDVVADDSLLQQLVTLERAALDRWIRIDPDGYLELYAPDITYFDPQREKRVDGLAAMQALMAPLRGMKSPFSDPRYDMIDPKVQRHGDVALLTFNLVSYAKPPNKPETVMARWNSTEVYKRIEGDWKIIHSHWSFVKPDVKPPAF